jgi:hypothetical protein
LTERRLPLWEMTPGVDLEGLRMSSDPLPVDDLHRRVADTLGKPDAGALSQLLMRPDHGCVSLVSVRSFFLLVSDCPWSSQSRLFVCLQEVGAHKPFPPPVPEDTVERAARRVVAEKRTRRRLGPVSGRGHETPWKGSVVGRRGMGSRGSHCRRRLTMTTTMKTMMKTTIWLPASALAQISG